MPTYEYNCGACGVTVEFFQAITAAPKRKCPECGALKLKRRISAGAGFLFRGNGFYTTDYRSDSYKAGEKAAKTAEKDSSSGSSSKKESSDSTNSKKANPVNTDA